MRCEYESEEESKVKRGVEGKRREMKEKGEGKEEIAKK
jgi:hypothetical protein